MNRDNFNLNFRNNFIDPLLHTADGDQQTANLVLRVPWVQGGRSYLEAILWTFLELLQGSIP